MLEKEGGSGEGTVETGHTVETEGTSEKISEKEAGEKGAETSESSGTASGSGEAKKAEGTERKPRTLSDMQRLGLQVLILVLILYMLFGHIVGLTTMPNTDMYPRIDSGDLLLYYRLDKDPKAQDIVVFHKNDTKYVGRVVAVQGDTVEITKEGSVLINGNSVIESNIFYETYPLEGFTSYPLTLGSGECFILADSRRGAEDSRFFGPVRYDELDGTVITVARRTNL
jgi:signal peptidase I